MPVETVQEVINRIANYKFLGWQNGWSHIYFDKDGNEVEWNSPAKSAFNYPREKYPEFFKCKDLGHKCSEIQHNRRGSENTVWCDICKIYWKYDCSD